MDNANPFDFMKNLGSMQERVKEMQAKMAGVTVTGSAGGDLVQVTLNGHMEVINVKIDPIAVDPRDVKMLEELVVSAFASASSRIKDKLKDEVGGMTGMDLSSIPGMNL